MAEPFEPLCYGNGENAAMTLAVTNDNKLPLVVPQEVRRRARFKSGQALEFSVRDGVITIAPKLSPDEIEDSREIADPKVRAIIREGYQEHLAGKSRPIEEFFAERAARRATRCRG